MHHLWVSLKAPAEWRRRVSRSCGSPWERGGRADGLQQLTPCPFCRPSDTLYEGAFLRATLSFPQDFPLNPPKMTFLSEMWHPNGTLMPYLIYSSAR